MRCLCGDSSWPGCDPDPDECIYYELGYEWCRRCREHHRPPPCITVIQGGQ